MNESQSAAYDAIVIGAGQGGGPLASAFAASGSKTALIERKRVGGTCVNEGCTPTKTMVASARAIRMTRRATDYGVRLDGGITVDMKAVRQRKRDIVAMFRSGSQSKLEKAERLDLIFGEARLTGRDSVVVERENTPNRSLRSELIIIDTGTSAAQPPIEGLTGIQFLDNRSIMELDEVPDHLLIVGGGYVAVEFGQMFRRFGSRVTILERASQLLPREDEDVADEVEKILRDEGVDVLTDAAVDQVRDVLGGGVAARVILENRARSIDGSHLLIAAGRSPNTAALNLASAGVKTDKRGFIEVNERLETNVPGIYAIGDVNEGPAFTHISYDDFRILKANLLDGGSRSTAGRLVPYAVFIDPQLGRVGLTEREATTQGRDFRVAKMPMSKVARALEVDETAGFMKVLLDRETGQILGAAILGIEGGELMSALEIAMMGKIPYRRLRDGVFAHPTLTESFNNLFQALD